MSSNKSTKSSSTFINTRYLRDSLTILEECVRSSPKRNNDNHREENDTKKKELEEERKQIFSGLVPFLLFHDHSSSIANKNKRFDYDDNEFMREIKKQRLLCSKKNEKKDQKSTNENDDQKGGTKRKLNEIDNEEDKDAIGKDKDNRFTTTTTINKEDPQMTTIHENQLGNSSATTTSSHYKSNTIRHYQVELNKLKDENKQLQTKRQKIYEGYKNFVSAYESGLHKISKLNDLTFVPDNVMNDNFSKST